jgi:hypothetical protein
MLIAESLERASARLLEADMKYDFSRHRDDALSLTKTPVRNAFA